MSKIAILSRAGITEQQQQKSHGAVGQDGPRPPVVTLHDLLVQFWADIYGKEVQSASTYSYTWIADQVGHMCIGIMLGFLLAIMANYLLKLLGIAATWDSIIGLLLAAVIVSYWEYRAYVSSVEDATHIFPLKRKLLRQNAVTAAGYMVIGAVIGFGFQQDWPWNIIFLLAMLLLAVLCAPSWLRQKIIWQKAALPYLFRLADVERTIEVDKARQLQALMKEGAKPYQVVIGGPINSGRTSMAAGIGTEFAFKNVKVRYLSFDSLLEFAAQQPFADDTGPKNINYWPWSDAQVIIIDDIGPLIAAGSQGANPDHFQKFLEDHLGPVAPMLGRCFTVWVVGDLHRDGGMTTIIDETLDRFAGVIARFCDVRKDSNEEKKFLVVELSRTLRLEGGKKSVSREADLREMTLQ